MTARIFDRADWHAARRRRAQRGKAPRLALERGILLRAVAGGSWCAVIQEKRFGIWRKPEQLCGLTSFEQARTAAVTAWNRLKMPLYWSPSGGRLQAYHLDTSVPRRLWS